MKRVFVTARPAASDGTSCRAWSRRDGGVRRLHRRSRTSPRHVAPGGFGQFECGGRRHRDFSAHPTSCISLGTSPGTVGIFSRELRLGRGEHATVTGVRRERGAARRHRWIVPRVRWTFGYCAEDRTPCRPHTTYGVCKHALQLLASEFAARHDLSSVWGRIFFLYGPHEHPDRLVSSTIRSLLARQPARCSHGMQVRDYLYVQDVADAFVALLDSDTSGPVNIASGRPITLREIALRIAELMNGGDLLQLGAIPAAATDMPLVVADMSQALTRIPGWEPRVSLDQGLAESIRWWREQAAAGTAGAGTSGRLPSAPEGRLAR